MDGKPPIEVDWTVDPETKRSNSSPEFTNLVSEISRLIKDSAHGLLNGQVEKAARLILAQLAHKHGLAPHRVSVQSAETNPQGTVRGVFVWHGVTYTYEATPTVPRD